MTAYGSLANSSEQVLREQLQWVLKGNCDKLAWRGAEVREHFRIVWQNDGPLLRKMFPVFDSKVILPFFSLMSYVGFLILIRIHIHFYLHLRLSQKNISSDIVT